MPIDTSETTSTSDAAAAPAVVSDRHPAALAGFAIGTARLSSALRWCGRLTRPRVPAAAAAPPRPKPAAPSGLVDPAGSPTTEAHADTPHTEPEGADSAESDARPAVSQPKRRCVAAAHPDALGTPRPASSADPAPLRLTSGSQPRAALPAAASLYLVPALHGAAQRRNNFFSMEKVWSDRVIEASGDYEEWRAECTDHATLPSWTVLVARVGGQAGDALQTISGGYISAGDQERLLGIVDGVLPEPLRPLQRWAGSRLQFGSAAREAGRPQCPFCDAPAASTTDSVTCAGPCGLRWHRGCVLVSTRRMANQTRWAASADSRRAWRCVSCTQPPATAAPAEAGVRDPHRTPRHRHRDDDDGAPLAPALAPASAASPRRQVRRGTAQPIPGDRHRSGAAMAADESASPPPPPRVDRTEPFAGAALQAAIDRLTAADAWEWVRACTDARPGPPRRYLPGGCNRSGPPLARRVAVATAAVVLQAAVDGSPAAQVLSLYLPRVFFRRGVEIPAQVADFVAGRRPAPSTSARSPPDAAMRLRQWCLRLGRAQEAGDIRAAYRTLEAGPEDTAWPESSKDEWLARLFPHQPEGEVADEATQWRDAAGALTAAAPWPMLSARDVTQWARARRGKAADQGGWSGQVILDMCSSDLHSGIANLLARLWGAPPSAWRDAGARAVAFRSATGVLLRQVGKDKPRPIAAPSVPRRIASAVDARRARTLADAYCVARGQVGLSYGGPLAAYSMFPRLVVTLGGTTCSADNTSSFQTFTRRGLLTGLTAALRSAEAQAYPEAAAALARLMTHYVMDGALLSRTTTSLVCGRTATSHALAQGCSSSPTAEALVLATAPRPPQPAGSIRRAAHDDSQASIVPGADIGGLAPPPAWGGAVYNTLKSVAVGPLAAEAVERGYAATAAAHASVFGAPVGDVASWAREVWLPRWLRTCANLRRAAAEAPDTAVLVAHLLRGPGTSASHWLRLAPCDAATRQVLDDADAAWVELWLDLARHDASSLSGETVARCADRLFGIGPDCFGHLSAGDAADARYWAGAAQAWPTVAAWAAEMRSSAVTPDTMARAIGVPADVVAAAAAHDDPDRLVGIVTAWLRSRSTSEAAALYACRAARRERIAHGARGCGRGAYASATAVDNGQPNLLLAALRDCAWTPAGLLSADGAGAPIVLARIFGLPVWPALGVAPPSQCRRCNASAYTCPCEAGALRRADAPTVPRVPDGLRANLDPHGDHLTACLRGGPAAGAKWRHDNFARDLARVSSAVGRGGHYHDGPVFDFGRRRRPADIMEGGNLCIDFAIGARQVLPVAPREAAKTAKYADQLRVHPDLRFSPFAVDLDGEIGPVAATTVIGWSRALATTRHRAGVPMGDPTADVAAAVGRAFTRGLVAQAVAWLGRTRGVT